MASVHEINFKPNPLQKQFIESRARADLFSSRMGEGKSTALAWAAMVHTRHNPGAKWAIIRDTWENLQATTMKTFFEWFPPGVMGSWHATKREFTWASGIANGSVTFLGMDAPEDASKLMSREFAGFAMDEPSPAVGSVGIDELVFDIAMSRLRQQGMKWYAAKLAENNPDETHWTYRKFSSPGMEGFRLWQPDKPENEAHLPPGYYAELRKLWGHRPDLIRRFVEGEFGFQSEGKAVTPQWNDKYHLAHGLIPIKGPELLMLWDFGLNPTAIFTQKTPLGSWLILDALVGEGIGAEELIVDAVRPLLLEKYRKFPLRHTGDPQGKQREQSSSMNSATRVLKKALGGPFIPGPNKIAPRIEPLRSALTRMIGGRGLVQVDKNNAAAVWQALRGGWHFHVSRTGITSGEPKKNIHSHPGDAVSYGAALLFPLGGKFVAQHPSLANTGKASYFENGPQEWRIGPNVRVIPPPHGAKLPS
jgi:hypothetical protein